VAWRYLLLPLAPVYRGVVAARRAIFSRGWLRRARLDVPVISVGNLTFGGTGKTPVVIALVRDLVRMGRRPAVLTRGYKRRENHQVVVVGPEPRQRVDEVGDEPLEMARRLPGVPVVVDANRERGGLEALRLGADVVVLDDGFQHLRLERDLDIVVIDAGDPWGGHRLPPLGRLREPVAALARWIVSTRRCRSLWHVCDRPGCAFPTARLEALSASPGRGSSPLPASAGPTALQKAWWKPAPRLSAAAGFPITMTTVTPT